MQKTYFTDVPKPKYDYLDIPYFMKKHERFNKVIPIFDLEYVLKLFLWAEREYTDAVEFVKLQNNYQLLERLQRYSPREVQAKLIAETKEFEQLKDSMDDKLWNSLPVYVQRYISEIYDLYLSNLN